LQKLVDVLRFDRPQLVSSIPRVELRVRETSAESYCVLAKTPDGIRGGIEAVLENARKAARDSAPAPIFNKG
jgi:hypothetical protein